MRDTELVLEVLTASDSSLCCWQGGIDVQFGTLGRAKPITILCALGRLGDQAGSLKGFQVSKGQAWGYPYSLWWEEPPPSPFPLGNHVTAGDGTKWTQSKGQQPRSKALAEPEHHHRAQSCLGVASIPTTDALQGCRCQAQEESRQDGPAG